MTYRFDPELVSLVGLLPVPEPASSDSGIVEATALREELNATIAARLAPVDLTGLVVADHTVPGLRNDPDVPVRLYRPVGMDEGLAPGIVNIHGGGFYCGSIYVGDTGAARLARELRVIVVDVEYRLAPDHAAPAAVTDCHAALVWLHDHATALNVDKDRIMVQGGSAGGGIAAGVALLARDVGGPEICFQSLLMPELDHRLDTPSMRRFGDTPLWNHHAAEQSWRWYLGGVSGAEVSPYASPSIAEDLRDLPPAYISVMEFDPLRDEGMQYARRLLEAGVTVELHLFPGTFHGSALASEASVTKRQTAELWTVLRRALGLQ
jgi:acetyl esterase/lipase